MAAVLSPLGWCAAGDPKPLTELASARTPGAVADGGLNRGKRWHRDLSSAGAYEKSIEPNRDHLRRLLGAVDNRVTAQPFSAEATETVTRSESLKWDRLRWPVFEGLTAEGLRLQPTNPPVAFVIAIPDAAQTPEMLAGLAPGLPPERQYARRLAEQGCEVLVPYLLERGESKPAEAAPTPTPALSRRDLICLGAFPLGRHLLGYEVQKVLAGADALFAGAAKSNGSVPKLAIVGYGEGGRITLYSAALDPRISAALVSGAFDGAKPPEAEPISRCLFGQRLEFGDAELATLVAPRDLIIEFSEPPALVSATGATAPPSDYETVEAEVERARTLLKGTKGPDLARFSLMSGAEGMATGPASDRALLALLQALGVNRERLSPPAPMPPAPDQTPAMMNRAGRQFEEFTQFNRALADRGEPGKR